MDYVPSCPLLETAVSCVYCWKFLTTGISYVSTLPVVTFDNLASMFYHLLKSQLHGFYIETHLCLACLPPLFHYLFAQWVN